MKAQPTVGSATLDEWSWVVYELKLSMNTGSEQLSSMVPASVPA